MSKIPARYNDTRMTTVSANRYFKHLAYVDPFAMVEDVRRFGWFDECNMRRQRQPEIRPMDRIECECADGWILLRVVAVDDRYLNIDTVPLQEPVYWAASEADAGSYAGDELPGDPAKRKPGRPPKAVAAA